jgi:hypothetical protein
MSSVIMPDDVQEAQIRELTDRVLKGLLDAPVDVGVAAEAALRVAFGLWSYANVTPEHAKKVLLDHLSVYLPKLSN